MTIIDQNCTDILSNKCLPYQTYFIDLIMLNKESADAASKEFHYFVTSLFSAFTAFTTWQTLKNQYYIYGRRKKIRQIEKGEIVEVDELVGKGAKINDVVLVKGKIGTKDGKQIEIKQGMFKSQKFAMHVSYSEAMYSNDSFKKDNYVLDMKKILKNCSIQGSHKITLYTEDNNKKRSSILIKNFDQKNYSKVMQVIRWQENRRSLDFVQHINAFFLSVLQALVTIGSEGKQVGHIRGIQVGKRDVEVGVKIGATVSILGTIGITTDGELFVEANQIFKDRLSELSDYRERLDELIKKRNFWLLCSLLGGIYLGRRAFKYCKQKNIKIPYLNP